MNVHGAEFSLKDSSSTSSSTLTASPLKVLNQSHSFIKLLSDAKKNKSNDVNSELSLSDKKNICFITINSSDEKEVFKKSLPKDQFNFTELVNPSNPQWFRSSCEARVSCDVLVISGHFAGVFFGDSGAQLSLEELEEATCSQRCEGVLSKPKEVYLFGCNTLSEKNADTRTQDEFVELLTEYNYPLLESEEIAESRYGTFGETHKNRFNKIFNKTPYIYGSLSKAKLGSQLKEELTSYLKSFKSYSQYLDQIQMNQSMRNAIDQPNLNIIKSLRGTNITQTSGINEENRGDDSRCHLCQLYNQSSSFQFKKEAIHQLLDEKGFSKFFFIIKKLIYNSETQSFYPQYSELFEVLREDSLLKESFLKNLNRLTRPVLKFEWIRFGSSLNWIQPESFLSYYEKEVTQILRNPAASFEVAKLCSYIRPKSLKEVPQNFLYSLKNISINSELELGAFICLNYNKTLKGLKIIEQKMNQLPMLPSEQFAFLVAPLVGLHDPFTLEEVPESERVEYISLRNELELNALKICQTKQGRWLPEVCQNFKDSIKVKE